jgi:hypothetical protein
MEIPKPASEPIEKKRVDIPIRMIDNPFFGKPFLTPFEALTAIRDISEMLIKLEKGKQVGE